MTWVATAVSAAGTIYGAYSSNKANKNAANVQGQAAQQGIGEIRGFYDKSEKNLTPYMDMGTRGNAGLTGLLNDPNSIQNSAAYKWRFGQGMQGLDQSAAARGSLFSGAHTKDAMEFGQGLASQEYGNEWQRMMGLSDMGLGAASRLGSFGADAGNSIAKLLGGAGDARASSYQANGMTTADTMGSLGSMFGNAWGQRGGSTAAAKPPSSGSGQYGWIGGGY